jgi:hypothetical protein
MSLSSKSNTSLLMLVEPELAKQLMPTMQKLFSQVDYIIPDLNNTTIEKERYTVVLIEKNISKEIIDTMLVQESKTRWILLLEKHDFSWNQNLNQQISRILFKPITKKTLIACMKDTLKSVLFDSIMEEKRRETVINRNKIRQLNKIINPQNVYDFSNMHPQMVLRMQNNIQSLHNSTLAYILDDTNNPEELEYQINDTLNLMIACDNATQERIYEIGILFRQYSCILFKEMNHDALSGGLLELSQMLLDINEDIMHDNWNQILEYLESFVYTLIKRRQEINTGSADSFHFYDQSMLMDLMEVNMAIASVLEGYFYGNPQ